MTSLARRHYQRMTAARAGTNETSRAAASGLDELMNATLHEHYRRLKTIKSIERKVEIKRDDVLPDFADYVDRVLESGTGEPNHVLMTVMVWRFDVGDLEGGLRIADYAMRHGLDAPDRYERDTPSIIAEQVAEESLARLKAQPEDADAAAQLVAHIEHASALTADADMHDPIRAKLEKAWGYALRVQNEHTADALAHLKRALDLNAQVGVKKDIEQLERQLKAQQNDGNKTS